MLQIRYNDAPDFTEIGIDEAGRGPLFGRLYVAAVVLPKGNEFRHEDMKDSKKFHSKTKIKKMATYIQENATAWSIQYIEAEIIDQINIRQSVFRAMHAAIKDILSKIQVLDPFLLVDGNDFSPYMTYDPLTEQMSVIPHVTIEGGDNKYTAIAAASILAKVAHDNYIQELCVQNPLLSERYGLDRNQGYGTKQHLDGIAEYGISQWHRKTFGPCKTAKLLPLYTVEDFKPHSG